ncbi:hypothetical protein NIES25_05860 [Nostoc linckia NIES-25]|nr:hypothetical protein NIES25_05860 [Nostoc linckia NIES-25]
MSTSSTISNLQQALNCAGKCDCCANLQSQINELKARITGLKPVDENAIIQKSVKLSEASIVPQISSAVAGGIAVVYSKLEPKITDAVLGGQAGRQAKARVESLEQFVNTVDGKATSAVSNAANASRQALNTANEVSGLKGIVNSIGTRLNDLGSFISKVEAKAGQALVNAAKAVGISEDALRLTGKWAGRVLELFNLVSTLFTLVEQLATLNLLGDRIDAVERAVQSVADDVSRVLGKLLGLQNRIQAVEGNVSSIRSLAQDALSIGSQAASIAKDAQSLAGTARSDARQAQSSANQAQTTADGAVRNATTANENAKTAYNKANEAKGIGEQAKGLAGQALQKGVEALGLAVTAISLYQTVRYLKGLKGDKGDRGLPGRDGLNGRNGFDGRIGPQGVPGITQIIQIPGIPGRNGRDGFNGLSGRQGPPGRDGRDGINGINGRNGVDAVPYNDAGLRAFIAAQHAGTRANSTAQHTTTRTTILTPIMTALAAILALLKQIYDAVVAVSNAAILALLNVINNKLGNQVLGGISGLITRIAQNSYLDKVLQVLTFAATMHNALMLSNQLGQTLIMIIDQVLGFILPKGIDGNPINFSEVLGKAVHEIIADTIGEANYTTLSEAWQKANRIYQAASNVFNQVTQLGGLITTGLEVIGGNLGKIGNALRKGGVLLENAYAYMNPQPNLQGKFFSLLNTANEKLSSIAAVVAIPIAFKEVLSGINSSTADLKREISQTDPKDENGNPIRDADNNIIHYKPGVEVPTPIVEEAKGEQAKADSTNFADLALEDIFDGGD